MIPLSEDANRYSVMAFNATFDNISVISGRTVLLGKETRVSVSKHRSDTNHWQILSHIEYTSPWARLELTTLVVIGTESTGRPLYILSILTIAFTVVLRRTASDYYFCDVGLMITSSVTYASDY